MDTNTPGWLSSPSERRQGRKTGKTTCLFSGVQFKYPLGVVLSVSGEGAIVWQVLSEVESGLRQLPGEGNWNGIFYPNILDSLDIWMPGAG